MIYYENIVDVAPYLFIFASELYFYDLGLPVSFY